MVRSVSTSSRGPPPRGRGARHDRRDVADRPRTIPAWAGSTAWHPARGFGLTDHPRVGREHLLRWEVESFAEGPPPRGRGAHEPRRLVRGAHRTTPAWAGSTIPAEPSRSTPQDHPRVGGEHTVLRSLRACQPDHPRVGGEQRSWSASGAIRSGPPPRGRGALARRTVEVQGHGTTPAWAGSTSGSSRPGRR